MQARDIILIGVMALGLMACEPTVNHRGHVTEEQITDKVEVGKTTKKQVEREFGSPSSQSSFGDETWYYIQARKEANAFLRADITEQEVTGIVFDADGVVKEIQHYNKEDGKQVAIVEDTTPTEGHSLGFFEQVFGNLGRFNKPREVSARGPGRR